MNRANFFTMSLASFHVSMGACFAQQSPAGGFTLVSTNVVSPTSPTTTVELWAWFDFVPTQAEIFGGAYTALKASEGSWDDPVFALHPLQRPPSMMIAGSTIYGVETGQVNFPPLIYAKTQNPILIFSAEWTTNEFTQREIDLTTFDTTKFWVIQNQQQGSPTMQLPLSSIFEGSGVIQVVPASAASVVFVIGLMTRRRRR